MGEYKNIPQEINNVVQDNLEKLAQLFPSAVKDGQLDVNALKEELGTFEEIGKEKYEFTWSGKQNAKKIAQQDVFGKTLKFCPEKSKNADTTENIYIEGDNLEALKLLRQNYYNSIKMIYIDPPYNTGNDFVYNDDFSMSQEESDIAEGVVDELGKRYTKNVSGNKFHANWCNMIYPRLKLAKDLLTDDGVIFISIDNNEYAQLKLICDTIFGELSYVTTIHVEMSATQGMKVKAAKDGNIVKNAEYIIIYSKDGHKNIAKKSLYDYRPEYDNHYVKFLKEDLSVTNLIDEYRRFSSGNIIKNVVESYAKDINFKEFVHSNANKIFRYDKTTGFSIDDFEIGKVYVINKNGREYFLQRKENAVEQLMFLSNSFGKCDDFKGSYGLRKIRGDWWKEFYLDMGNVSKEGNIVFANGKKPIRLISQLAKMITDRNDIILDFFSGSATTAHAIMQLNAEDGGNRKFILVQLPEVTNEKSEAYKAGYNTICEIGEERIRRAGDKIKAKNPDADVDIGFKVFEIADTNIKWNELELKDEQIDFANLSNNPDQVDFKQGTKDIDVVYEIMLRQKNIPLSSKVEVLDEIGSRTYLYADSYLICLETQVTNEMIDKLASLDPTPFKYIFRDSAFKDDIDLKTNAFRRLKAMVEKHAGATKKAYTVEFI